MLCVEVATFIKIWLWSDVGKVNALFVKRSY